MTLVKEESSKVTVGMNTVPNEELEAAITSLRKKKSSYLRQADDIETEIIGLKEELRRRSEKKDS